MVKKLFLFVSLMALMVTVAAAPAFAASTWDAEIKATVLDEDFEAYPTNDVPFNEEVNAAGTPAGFKGKVYGGMQGREHGALIVADKIGGTKSIRFLREGASGTQQPNIRYFDLSTEYGGAKKIAVQLAFRFETLGTYGFTALIGTGETNMNNWNGADGNSNILAVKKDPDTESPSIMVRDAGELKVIKKDLEAKKDYVLTFVFELGTDNYSVVLNNEVIGNYQYFETVNKITAFRMDEHGYYKVDEGQEEKRGPAVEEVYLDDIKIGTVVEKSGEQPSTPTVPTGDDATALAGAGALLLLSVGVVFALKKKNAEK